MCSVRNYECAVWIKLGDICGCHVVAMWLPCGCHVLAMWLPLGCHVIATGLSQNDIYVMHDAKAIGYCGCVFMYIASLFMLIDLHDFQLNEDHDPEHNP